MPDGKDEHAIVSVSTHNKSLADLLSREWLLTNSRGGFASGTLAGCNTRRYHGLLIGTVHPPAGRTVALANCLETLDTGQDKLQFSCFEFDRTIYPQGHEYLLDIRVGAGVHFEYELGVARLVKSVYLHPDSDMAAIVYDFSDVCRGFDFSVRPLVALRDFHGLQNASTEMASRQQGGDVIIRGETSPDTQLNFWSEGLTAEQDPQWWYKFYYRVESFRGQDCFEDLWSPCRMECRVERPMRVVLWASLTPPTDEFRRPENLDVATIESLLAKRLEERTQHAYARDPIQKVLFSASGDFLIRRKVENEQTWTIIAGYPWFLDWGRDAFIALPGLCLSTGRLEIALSVLQTFANAVSEGMIPNRFDDYGNAPHYNSIDASLWFVHAALAWRKAGGSRQEFARKLLPAIREIMDAYRQGTRFGIHADRDGLITGGDEETQLTWMDAKHGNTVFTPRYGKAVEINALWYSNLRGLAEYCESNDPIAARETAALADRVRESFVKVFWNEEGRCLYDCVFPDGTPDDSLRPNQVFAVSLPHSPLDEAQQKCVVHAVQRELLTPYGLRTLSPRDERYIGRFEGDAWHRDAAYHQGTVWSWLIGPFVEAYLKVHQDTPASRKQCAAFLHPLILHLVDSGCIGTISEVFDGTAPHRPGGCVAQAWSVAELLRAWLMIQKNVV